MQKIFDEKGRRRRTEIELELFLTFRSARHVALELGWSLQAGYAQRIVRGEFSLDETDADKVVVMLGRTDRSELFNEIREGRYRAKEFDQAPLTKWEPATHLAVGGEVRELSAEAGGVQDQ